jgi:acetyl esterase/lipase
MTPPLSDVSWTTRRIPVPAIGGEVTLYLINSQPGAARPAILHTHGGGFISGSPRNDLPRLQRMARELDVAIVSVAYDLAPEARYARSIEQTYAGLVWTHDHAAEIGVDRRRIAVMGESAGGGHAAMLALLARDRGQVPLCFQCLIYPMLDDRTGSTRHPVRPLGELIWTAGDNRSAGPPFWARHRAEPKRPPSPCPRDGAICGACRPPSSAWVRSISSPTRTSTIAGA